MVVSSRPDIALGILKSFCLILWILYVSKDSEYLKLCPDETKPPSDRD